MKNVNASPIEMVSLSCSPDLTYEPNQAIVNPDSPRNPFVDSTSTGSGIFAMSAGV